MINIAFYLMMSSNTRANSCLKIVKITKLEKRIHCEPRMSKTGETNPVSKLIIWNVKQPNAPYNKHEVLNLYPVSRNKLLRSYGFQ